MAYDVVIVGAGASGCALANRLSEDPALSVLLLERGGRAASPSTLIPRAFPYALSGPLLTSYLAELADGQRDYWVRGRALGGSTVVNGMMYLRGEPAAYDELATAGNPGWAWNAFAAAFDDLETRFLHPSASSVNPLDERLIDAIATAGARRVDDLNGATGQRVGPTPATIYRGLRHSAARALLKPVRNRANLHVLPSVDVDELLWDADRVVGVRVRRGSASGEIRARTTVLSAGAVETPLMLERSGIGRADILGAAGIALRVDSPNVGERIIEQRGHGVQLRLNRWAAGSRELAGPIRQAMQAARYALTRGGALARPAYDVTGLVAATGSDVDTQVMAVPFGLDQSALRPAPYPAIFLCGYPTRPTTSSSVHVGADGQPVIHARHKITDADITAGRATDDLLARIAAATPLADLVDGIDPAASTATGTAIYHAVGSAAMGPHGTDVVDADLRVRGAPGLRIADLSVLPFHTSGSTAAPAMAIGWLVADRIRNTTD